MLKNNKFTFSGLDSFQEKSLERKEEHNPDMYSIGDDDEDFEVETTKKEKEKEIRQNKDVQGEFEELNVDIDDVEEFEEEGEIEEGDDLDDEEYFKQLEEDL